MASVFIARQPIFTADSSVYAYELLARSGAENLFLGSNPTTATAETVSGGLAVFGLGRLTGGKPAFVNFGRELLVGDYWRLLPTSTVIEVLEDVEPDDEVLSACQRARTAGYQIALDDVSTLEPYDAFKQLVDILKVDFRKASPRQRTALPREIARFARPPMLVAEKVEDRAEFKEAISYGYHYLQGYYLARPELVSGTQISPVKLHLIQLLHAAQSADFDYREIETIVRHDVSLAFKVLRFANSAAMGLRLPVKSLHQALVILGRDRIVRLAALLVVAAIGTDQPQELAVRSIIRAHFCEGLARAAGLQFRELDLFLLGMFSAFDTLLGAPFSETASILPASPEVQRTLMGEAGVLRDVLGLTLAYEAADWVRVSEIARALRVIENELPPIYLRALSIGDEVYAEAA